METLKNLETTHKVGLALLVIVILYFVFSSGSSSETASAPATAAKTTAPAPAAPATETKKERFQVAPQAGFNNMVLTDDNGNLAALPFPKGMIMLWHESPDKVPAGWALCDGENGTPDLRGRFVVGVNPENSRNPNLSPYNWTKAGGKETTTFKLGVEHMPEHDHDLIQDPAYDSGSSWDSDRGRNVATPCLGRCNKKTTKTGGGQPYTIPADEKLPPFYALVYIMKL